MELQQKEMNLGNSESICGLILAMDERVALLPLSSPLSPTI